MNKERDLLPWILGGLSVAAAALAVTAVSTKNAATSNRQPTTVAAAAPAPVSISPQAPSPAPTLAPSAEPSTEAEPHTAAAGVPTDIEPAAPSGQIWECTTKGVKTFSNNPCGEKSTLLEVGPINTMNPTPPRYARAYASAPHYTAAYSEPAASYDQDDYTDQAGSETGGDTYTIVQGAAFIPRRRPEHHPHRPPHHHGPSGPMPRKY